MLAHGLGQRTVGPHSCQSHELGPRQWPSLCGTINGWGCRDYRMICRQAKNSRDYRSRPLDASTSGKCCGYCSDSRHRAATRSLKLPDYLCRGRNSSVAIGCMWSNGFGLSSWLAALNLATAHRRVGRERLAEYLSSSKTLFARPSCS